METLRQYAIWNGTQVDCYVMSVPKNINGEKIRK